MIMVKRLNGESFAINENLIETIEERPDTVITLTNGNKYIVKEKIVDIIQKIKEFKEDILKKL
ncbi:MAG: flagellar FlbD family protein [Peptostreptococcaceae bacterium]|nr:flagellar FlbD family protein [Peptostreptococcaceae bacterium]